MNKYNIKYISGIIMIINDLKKILLDVDITLTELASALGKRLNKEYSLNNLSNKLHRETITHKEMLIIADILGYELKFVPKEK